MSEGREDGTIILQLVRGGRGTDREISVLGLVSTTAVSAISSQRVVGVGGDRERYIDAGSGMSRSINSLRGI